MALLREPCLGSLAVSGPVTTLLPLYSHNLFTCVSPSERAYSVVRSCGKRGGSGTTHFPSIPQTLVCHTCFHANFPNPHESCNPRAARRYLLVSSSIESNPFSQLILSFPGGRSVCPSVRAFGLVGDWLMGGLVGGALKEGQYTVLEWLI